MNILCATDNNYVQHCYIMLLSLFDSNSTHEINVYILVSKLTDESNRTLESISSNPSHQVHLIEVEDKLEYCPVRSGDHISTAAYYRILAPVLLPKEIDKILYLDVDMIICKDLSSLYNVDIEDCGVGAVLDADCSLDKYERLEYSSSLGYVNSGVLLMNLKYWREYNIMEECLDFVRDYPEKCLFHDQDAINYVLRERKKLLPLKYNFQIWFLVTFNKIEPHILREIHSIVEQESYAIIHYTASKPWHRGCYSPYREYYYKHKKLSPYAHIPIPRQPIGWLVKRWLYNACASIGLVKPTKTYIVKNGKFDVQIEV